MHITFITMGSRGDLQPYIALGLGLRASGHVVRIVTHRHFEAMVRASGMEFSPLAGDPLETLKSSTWRRTLEEGENPFHFMRAYLALLGPYACQATQDCW